MNESRVKRNESPMRLIFMFMVLIPFLFSGQVISGTAERRNGKVQRGDQFIVETSVKYEFTSKLIPQREKRLMYNYILNKLISGESEESSAVVSELLPTAQDRVEFLKTVYKVVDSVVWGDGNGYAAYEILLDFDDFGEQGFFLANKAVARNAKDCNLLRLDILFVMEFVCDARPEAAPTLHLIADCDLKSGEYGRLALVSSVGLARIGRLKEAQVLLKEDEKRAKGDKDFMNECVQTRKLIANIPPKWGDLYARLEEIFL
ncbi:MAG: hypothetical protein GXO69_01850 [Acidobacteria bacterium]|nr:hypothetical protein [Acidobacteriota bacterium]